MSAVVCHDVRRYFKDVHALDGVDLTVPEHQIFGLLGPNGSGKTTLLNQLQGLDRPTSGEVTVLGLNPVRDHQQLSTRFGAQLQQATLIPRLTVVEAMRLFAALYPHHRDLDAMLAAVGLTAKATARVEKLSGGQRQRLFIALAQLHDPELIFFDELTSAVDPQARLAIWDLVRQLKADGRTVMLTTHSMEEAQELCDRVAIIDAGRIIAEGTVPELLERYAGDSSLHVRVSGDVDESALRSLPGVASVTRDGAELTVAGVGDFATTTMAALASQGAAATDLTLRQANLEDVFLNLTGRRMREGE